MTRHTRYALVLLAAAMVVGAGAVATLGGTVLSQQGAAVTMSDQGSDGETLIVDSVTLPEGGFVVVHDESLDDGDVVDSVIGVSQHLPAGTHEDVPVTVAPSLDSVPDVEVTAMAHRDTNANGVFDFVASDGGLDGAYTPPSNETGNETPMMNTATIDASGDQVPATNLEFESQSTDGTTLTVQRVMLYRGGYVVIHDSTLQEEGDAVGSVVGHSTYMVPGTYEDLTITLARPLEDEGNVTVTAMPHFETNGNLLSDFVHSLGAEDGDAVVQTTAVTVEGAADNETETATPTETEGAYGDRDRGGDRNRDRDRN